MATDRKRSGSNVARAGTALEGSCADIAAPTRSEPAGRPLATAHRLSSPTAGAGQVGGHDDGARRLEEIARVYRSRFPSFLRVATAILGDVDRGRDAVQEAFARAIGRRLEFRGEGSMEAWLWRTVVNVACNHRRYAGGVAGGDAAAEPAAPVPLQPDAELRELVASLPLRQRTAVFLRYYADLEYEQIAEVMGVRPGTVGAALNSAVAHLRSEVRRI